MTDSRYSGRFFKEDSRSLFGYDTQDKLYIGYVVKYRAYEHLPVIICFKDGTEFDLNKNGYTSGENVCHIGRQRLRKSRRKSQDKRG